MTETQVLRFREYVYTPTDLWTRSYEKVGGTESSPDTKLVLKYRTIRVNPLTLYLGVPVGRTSRSLLNIERVLET